MDSGRALLLEVSGRRSRRNDPLSARRRLSPLRKAAPPLRGGIYLSSRFRIFHDPLRAAPGLAEEFGLVSPVGLTPLFQLSPLRRADRQGLSPPVRSEPALLVPAPVARAGIQVYSRRPGKPVVRLSHLLLRSFGTLRPRRGERPPGVDWDLRGGGIESHPAPLFPVPSFPKKMEGADLVRLPLSFHLFSPRPFLLGGGKSVGLFRPVGSGDRSPADFSAGGGVGASLLGGGKSAQPIFTIVRLPFGGGVRSDSSIQNDPLRRLRPLSLLSFFRRSKVVTPGLRLSPRRGRADDRDADAVADEQQITLHRFDFPLYGDPRLPHGAGRSPRPARPAAAGQFYFQLLDLQRSDRPKALHLPPFDGVHHDRDAPPLHHDRPHRLRNDRTPGRAKPDLFRSSGAGVAPLHSLS